MRNHGEWCERNGEAASPYARLFSILFLHRRASGELEMRGLSTAGAEAERLCDEQLNHPDADLADPEWNASGVPWHTLHYKGNYPRLQQIKARWDPLNVFQRALSIRADTSTSLAPP